MSIIDSFLFKGYDAYASQHPNTPGILFDFLSIAKPSTVLEIGTYHGGLTLIIHDHLLELQLNETPIYTYDLRIGEHRIELDKRIAEGFPIHFSNQNLFTPDYKSVEKVDEVSSIIKREGTTVIFCDGGKKVQEVRLLVPFMKEGDYILAHDYTKTEKYFEDNIKDIFWPSFEITGEQIQDVVEQYNLTQVLEEELQSVVWGCWRKGN